MTWKLSGFADEIDPDPHVQAAVLAALGATHAEIRSAWGTNISQLSPAQLEELKGALDTYDLKVSAIGSPIGKVDIADPLEREQERLDTVLTAARALGTTNVRIFSFYYPERTRAEVRDAVVTGLEAFTDQARAAGVTLLHENEKEIYGDTDVACQELLEAVNDPHFRAAFDPANFVQVGVKPYTQAWPRLKPWVDYFQVKDARFSDAHVVPSGEGDGELPELIAALVDAGYSGFTSMEPHLVDTSAAGGFSGARAFGTATRAFVRLAEQAGVTFA